MHRAQDFLEQKNLIQIDFSVISFVIPMTLHKPSTDPLETLGGLIVGAYNAQGV